jgi:hypothetical protein
MLEDLQAVAALQVRIVTGPVSILAYVVGIRRRYTIMNLARVSPYATIAAGAWVTDTRVVTTRRRRTTVFWTVDRVFFRLANAIATASYWPTRAVGEADLDGRAQGAWWVTLLPQLDDPIATDRRIRTAGGLVVDGNPASELMHDTGGALCRNLSRFFGWTDHMSGSTD